MPAEFVRLRYFFGQRLGVVDLADEQSYLVGKQRFHNQRAHGAGVLCGLQAERYVFPQGTASTKKHTTVLRVRRGAALDAEGREIVVGWDQCVDVAAWFQQKMKGKLDEKHLWVALRYRECPSDPAPAPRDPCGCDAGGCEYARTREGFELMLLTEAEAKACTVKAPALQHLLHLHAEQMLHGTAEAMLDRAVAGLIGEPCPTSNDDSCLLLARFAVDLDADGAKVINIGEPDNAAVGRVSLVPTALLQEALLHLMAGAADAGQLGDGPRLSDLTFHSSGEEKGTLSIAISLAKDHTPFCDPVSSIPAALKTKVSFFDDEGHWSVIPLEINYMKNPRPHLALDLKDLKPGRYRVLVETNHAQPPVDKKMRPLSPPQWARHFRLEKNDMGTLVLAKTLY